MILLCKLVYNKYKVEVEFSKAQKELCSFFFSSFLILLFFQSFFYYYYFLVPFVNAGCPFLSFLYLYFFNHIKNIFKRNKYIYITAGVHRDYLFIWRENGPVLIKQQEVSLWYFFLFFHCFFLFFFFHLVDGWMNFLIYTYNMKE